jgi:hypothetical protein
MGRGERCYGMFWNALNQKMLLTFAFDLSYVNAASQSNLTHNHTITG